MAGNDEIADGGDYVDSAEGLIEASGLYDSLGPSAKIRIVDVLINAAGPLNPHDIADSANISRSAFYDNRETLLDYGLMKQVGTAGNSKLYEFGDSHLAELIEKYTDYAGAKRRGILDEE